MNAEKFIRSKYGRFHLFEVARFGELGDLLRLIEDYAAYKLMAAEKKNKLKTKK